MLPLVVVIAALTFTSRPQQATTLPLVAVIAALMFTSRSALSRSVVALDEATQAIGSLTLMSPLPVVAVPSVVIGGAPGTVASGPGRVLMITLLVTSRAESVAPEMLLLAPPTLKSCGSISHEPVVP